MSAMTSKSSSNNEKNYRDLVDYQPVILKVIDDKNTLDILSDPNIYAVLSVLRNGPMTVKEIEAEYNEPLNSEEAEKQKEQLDNNKKLN